MGFKTLCCDQYVVIVICYIISSLFFSTWTAKEGPRKDFYNIGDNPQYKLEVKGSGPKVVWILMTRHITDKVSDNVVLENHILFLQYIGLYICCALVCAIENILFYFYIDYNMHLRHILSLFF